MLVVAGPPGSGKSVAFPVRASGLDHFNVDDRCAELNGGSYSNVSPAIRAQASRECEEFVADHIRARRGFAVESTLRTRVALDQAEQARVAGFRTSLRFVATESVDENIARVAARADAGGHSAPPEQIRAIYDASLKNLAAALDAFDLVRVYDNTRPDSAPRLVLEARRGRVTRLVAGPPTWLRSALRGTMHERALSPHSDRDR